jgi:hypothetical protein
VGGSGGRWGPQVAGEEELDAAAGDQGGGGNRSAGDRRPQRDARARATRTKRMGVLGVGCSPLSLRGQEMIFEGLRNFFSLGMIMGNCWSTSNP